MIKRCQICNKIYEKVDKKGHLFAKRSGKYDSRFSRQICDIYMLSSCSCPIVDILLAEVYSYLINNHKYVQIIYKKSKSNNFFLSRPCVNSRNFNVRMLKFGARAIF